jgi:hypothetical protein
MWQYYDMVLCKCIPFASVVQLLCQEEMLFIIKALLESNEPIAHWLNVFKNVYVTHLRSANVNNLNGIHIVQLIFWAKNLFCRKWMTYFWRKKMHSITSQVTVSPSLAWKYLCAKVASAVTGSGKICEKWTSLKIPSKMISCLKRWNCWILKVVNIIYLCPI